jgi:hypothetical protein
MFAVNACDHVRASVAAGVMAAASDFAVPRVSAPLGVSAAAIARE